MQHTGDEAKRWLRAELRLAQQEPDAAAAQLALAWPRWQACTQPDAWSVALGLHVVDLLVRLWRFDDLEPLLPRLVDWAQAVGEPLLQARAAAAQASQDVRKGRFGLALTAVSELASLAQAHPEPPLQALHALTLGRVLQGQNEHARALDCFHDADALLTPAGLTRLAPMLWMRISQSQRALQQWPAYRAALQRTVASALAQQDHAAACNALTGVAEDGIRRGDLAAAQAALAQAQDLLPRVPARQAQLSSEILAARAHLSAAAQRWDEAAAQMLQVIEIKRASSTRLQTVRRLRDLAPWQLQAGQAAAALATLEQAHALELEALRDAQTQELQLRSERLEREQARQAQQGAERHAQELARANRALSDALGVQRELLDQLVQSSRQAALGAMLAGLAHELNTPLGTVLTAVSTTQDRARQLHRRLLEGKLGRASLTADLQALEEGSELAQRNLQRVLQHIAGYQDLNPGLLAAPPRPVDLAELVRQSWQRAVPPGSPLQLVLDAELTVEVCADSLQAVLVELLLNVQRHAYPAASTGEVRVQARQDGALLRLVVADNGRGIAPELLPRVFDPYVSTQFGRGRSGLGLFSAQALVTTRLRGALHADSPPGQGARFEIAWPLTL